MTLENPFQPQVLKDATAPADADGSFTVGAAEGAERPYTPAEGLDPEAPYGYTIDRKTGTKRPRKRAGRAAASRAQPETESTGKPEREPDKVPGRVRPPTPRRRGRATAPKPDPEPLPVFRAGPIAKAVNRLYLRAGKLVRAMDADIGIAIISMTKAETEDDVTVGDAWEEVARLNPRIRAVLLRLIAGGAWTQLFMVHAPLLLAIVLKERIAKRLPLMGLLASFLNDDEGEEAVESPAGGLLAGMTQEDLNEAMAAFSLFMPPMADWPQAPPRAPMPTRAAVYEDLPLPDEEQDAPA